MRIFPFTVFPFKVVTRFRKTPRSLVSIILLHRDPAIWPNPLKFDPDRFLPENTRRIYPYAFIPFSVGPRNYKGQRLVLLEEKIVLIAILRKRRIKSAETPAELTLYDTDVLLQVSTSYTCAFFTEEIRPTIRKRKRRSSYINKKEIFSSCFAFSLFTRG